MAHADQTHDASQYYFPHGSRLPFFGSISLFILMAVFDFGQATATLRSSLCD